MVHCFLSKAFVVLILMTSWLTLLDGQDDRELQIIELFAGQARITRLGKACGIPCQAHDWDYDRKAKNSKGSFNNAFDITGPAGLVFLRIIISSNFIFKKPDSCKVVQSCWYKKIQKLKPSTSQPRLILRSLQRCQFDLVTVIIGLLCSSWVVINSGTSKRDELLPHGDEDAPSVKKSNLMTARNGDYTSVGDKNFVGILEWFSSV